MKIAPRRGLKFGNNKITKTAENDQKFDQKVLHIRNIWFIEMIFFQYERIE